MTQDDAQRQGSDAVETRLRREAAAYRPRVGRDSELRWHRALVEAKAAGTNEGRRVMPWRLVLMAAGTAVAGLVLALAVLRPWQVAPTPAPGGQIAQQPMVGPIVPMRAITDVGEMIQSPMNREMDAIGNDAQRMLRTMVWFEGSEAPPPAKAGT